MHLVEDMTVDGLNWVRIVTLIRGRWMSNNHITRCDRKSDQLERRCWNVNHVLAEAGPMPPFEQPRRTGKKDCDSQKSWGGQYIVVFVRSPTHLSHTTLSNKVRSIFVLNMFLRASAYEYVIYLFVHLFVLRLDFHFQVPSSWSLKKSNQYKW